MAKIEKYQQIARRMMKADNKKVLANRHYDAMYHCDWELPGELTGIQWMRAVTSTDIHDAINAGVRVIATLDPRPTIVPLNDMEEDRQQANEWERNLLWQLKSAEQRRQGGVVSDIAHSAIRYDEVVAQVIDLDYQIEQLDLIEADTHRYKAARRYGRFMVNVYHPSDVSVEYSDMMPEVILLHQRKSVAQVMREWGKNASGLKEWLSDEEEKFCIVYDLTNYDERVVWAETETGGEAKYILAPSKNSFPFISWVAMVGGTTLERGAEHKRHPLAYSIYRSGQWNTQNIVRSLAVSDAIRAAGSKRDIVKTIDPNNPPDINDGDPTSPVVLGLQEDYQQKQPYPLDRALIELDDRIANSMDKATVSRVLQNADVGSNVAFSTLNLATQTAVGALKPYKRLAEKALAETMRLMLLWVYYTKKNLQAYGRDAKSDMGQQYSIEWQLISPDALYISVELTPDVPTDRLQRVNAASIAVNAFNYPIARALEDIGVTDPEKAMEQRQFELMEQMFIQQEIQAMFQAEQLQEQQAAQAQAAQQSQLAGPGGIPGIEGPGFNPALGGIPPQMAAPDATREMQAMSARDGTETGAGGLL